MRFHVTRTITAKSLVIDIADKQTADTLQSMDTGPKEEIYVDELECVDFLFDGNGIVRPCLLISINGIQTPLWPNRVNKVPRPVYRAYQEAKEYQKYVDKLNSPRPPQFLPWSLG